MKGICSGLKCQSCFQINNLKLFSLHCLRRYSSFTNYLTPHLALYRDYQGIQIYTAQLFGWYVGHYRSAKAIHHREGHYLVLPDLMDSRCTKSCRETLFLRALSPYLWLYGFFDCQIGMISFPTAKKANIPN